MCRCATKCLATKGFAIAVSTPNVRTNTIVCIRQSDCSCPCNAIDPNREFKPWISHIAKDCVAHICGWWCGLTAVLDQRLLGKVASVSMPAIARAQHSWRTAREDLGNGRVT
jgi:hypothetical protein